jgi:hypothetical protein
VAGSSSTTMPTAPDMMAFARRSLISFISSISPIAAVCVKGHTTYPRSVDTPTLADILNPSTTRVCKKIGG